MTVSAPFAEIEADVAVETLAMLANASATVIEPSDRAGGEFPVIFDAAYIPVLQVDSVGPVASALDTDIAGLEQGAVLEIRGKQYEVRKLEPDGAGVTQLRLREIE